MKPDGLTVAHSAKETDEYTDQEADVPFISQADQDTGNKFLSEFE